MLRRPRRLLPHVLGAMRKVKDESGRNQCAEDGAQFAVSVPCCQSSSPPIIRPRGADACGCWSLLHYLDSSSLVAAPSSVYQKWEMPTCSSSARSGTAMNAPVKKSKLIKGATGDWEVVIGMEVHAQVTSHSKLFSGASTAFGGEPNSHVWLVDAAMPGMLPVINEDASRRRPSRARAQGEDQSALGVRPEELFLSRPAAGLPDQPVQFPSSARAR